MFTPDMRKRLVRAGATHSIRAVPANDAPTSALDTKSESLAAPDTSPALAAAATPSVDISDPTQELRDLAASLGNDPDRIFAFVRDTIDYEHYFGAKKGAMLTYLEGCGNDIDQCALLAALLRASGWTVSFVHQWHVLPYGENLNPSEHSAVTWLGFPISSLSTDTKRNNLDDYFVQAGFKSWPVSVFYDSSILVQRMVLKASKSKEPSFIFDPSMKHRFTQRNRNDFNITTSVAFDRNAFLNSLGGTSSENGAAIAGFNMVNIKPKLTAYTKILRDAIDRTHSGYSPQELLGIPQINSNASSVDSGYTYLVTSSGEVEVTLEDGTKRKFPYKNDEYGQNIPAQLVSKLIVAVNNFSANDSVSLANSVSFYFTELQGKTLAATHDGNVVQIRLADIIQKTATIVNSYGYYNLCITAEHPFQKFAINESEGFKNSAISDSTGTTPIYRTRTRTNQPCSYAITYGFAPGKRALAHQQKKLDDLYGLAKKNYPAAFTGSTFDSSKITDSNLLRKITTQSLDAMGTNWLHQTAYANSIIAAINHLEVPFLHRIGRVGQEEGFYIDVGFQTANPLSRGNSSANRNAYLAAHGLFFSAFEHGIIEQHNSDTGTAVSTVQILSIANANNKVIRIDAANKNSALGVLQGYNSSQIAKFRTSIDGGAVLFLPKNANNTSSNWVWRGTAWVDLSANYVSMMISNGYSQTSGGMNNVELYINPEWLFANNFYAPFHSETMGNIVIAGVSPSTFTNATPPVSNEPIDLLTGAYLYDHLDFSVGKGGTRGLAFQRFYSSSRRDGNPVRLGNGWTHNFDMRLSTRTDAPAALGSASIAEASPMLAAAVMINELVKPANGATVTDVKSLVAAALIAKTAVDSLVQNAAVITLGKDSIQFIKAPDGTYIPPAGSTLSLTKLPDTPPTFPNPNPVKGNYILKERHGNTFLFSGEEKHILSIADPFNKQIRFVYEEPPPDPNGMGPTLPQTPNPNPGKFLLRVTDNYGNKLRFAYENLAEPSIARIKSVLLSDDFYYSHTVTFTHDSAGNLTAVRDPLGNTTSFTYDSQKRLTKLTDPQGRVLATNTYNDLHQVTAQCAEGSAAKQWNYTYSGHSTTETNPLQKTTTYGFDARGRTLFVKDANGNTTSNAYDSEDHLLSSTSPEGKVTKYAYDANQNLIQTVLPNDTITTYGYDSLHRLISIKTKAANDPTARTTTLGYNPDNSHNLPIRITPPVGAATHIEYDATGLVTKTTTDNLSTLYTYDAEGFPATITLPNGSIQTFSYNSRGDLLASTNPAGHTTDYEYDALRRLIRTRLPAPAAGAARPVIEQTFDAAGNLATTRDPLGTLSRHTYTVMGKPLVSTIAADTATAIASTTLYDIADRAVETRTAPPGTAFPAAPSSTSFPAPAYSRTRFEYDNAGRLIRTLDILNRATTTAYNKDGSPISITTPTNRSSKTEYNNIGLPLKVTDPAGNFSENTYNGFGELRTYNNRRRKNYAFSYNNNGNLISQTTPTGKITTTEWNTRNLVSKIKTPLQQNNANATSFTYDNLNRLAAHTDPAGTIQFAYDANGNPLTVKETPAGISTTNTLTRTFDNLDRVTSYTNASGERISYSYDLGGRLTGITYPGNKTVLYSYNNRDQLLTVKDWQNRVTTYTYDGLGRLLTITRPNGTVRTNLYDIASRLISYQERTATGDLIAYGTFGYDNDDRILSRYRIPNYATAVGTAALPTAAPQPAITNATYDDDNRLTNVTLATVPAGGGTATTTAFAIAHDLDGNMTNAPLLPAVTASVSPASVPALTPHTYDARNRLTNIAATANRPYYSYTYDAENNRLSQTVTTSGTAQTTRYTFDPHGDALPRVLIRTKPNGEKTFYIYGIGLLYEINTNAAATEETNIRYYHYDNLGSTIALTAPRAASGDTPITDRAEYDFHGRTLYRTGTTDTPFLYVGQFGIQTDPTGLHHMRARYYSPLLLRFISADPLGFAAGSNFYTYAGNSPLLYIDPSGLASVKDYLRATRDYFRDDWSLAKHASESAEVFYGYGDAALMTITGAVNVVLDAPGTVRAIGNAINDPFGTARAIQDITVQTWNSGYRGKGRVIGEILLVAATMGTGKAIATAGKAEELVLVSRWGRAGLQSGDWVQLGGMTQWNFRLTGKGSKWGWKQEVAEFSSGMSELVPSAHVHWPSGWERLKGTFGQRKFDVTRTAMPYGDAAAIGLGSALGFYSLAKSGEIALYGGLKITENGGRK